MGQRSTTPTSTYKSVIARSQSAPMRVPQRGYDEGDDEPTGRFTDRILQPIILLIDFMENVQFSQWEMLI